MASTAAAAALNPMWRATRVSSSSSRALRTALVTSSASVRRYASNNNNNPDNPIVLEKPARFNPPSHGTRLPRKQPRHYGGNTTEDERASQKKREYPGMLPPEGSSAHKILHNRNFHLIITLGTLAVLAISTFVLNFTHTSPFRHLLPPASEFWSGPFQFLGTWWRVIQLHENDRNAKAIAHHTRTTDDVMKRAAYRKAHGLDKENPIKNWLSSGDEEEKGEQGPADDGQSPIVSVEGLQAVQESEGQGRKKWFGVF